MNSYLASVTGPLGWGIFTAVLLFLACIGSGGILLKKVFHIKNPELLLSLTLGMDTAALLFFLASRGGVHKFLAPLFLLSAFPGIRELCRFRFHKDDFFLLLPAGFLLLPAGFAIVPPFAWDDTVYQLTVPLRWARDGGVPVYSDLVYSGFPLLPQFLYRELILLSGVSSARIFSFLVFGSCAFAFRTFLPGRKAVIPAVILLSAPMMLHISSACYAESFLALNFLSAVAAWKTPLLSGLFGGFACGVKLSGIFPAAASCLYGVLKKRDPAGKRILFYGIGMIAGLLFYLRPLILTGNPFYPYFAWMIPGCTPAAAEMSRFHHVIGGASFGTFSPAGTLLAPVLLALPGFDRIYDGTWGIPMLILLFSALLTLRNGLKTALPGTAVLLCLYIPWVILTPQARFLLPAVMFCALAGTVGFHTLPEKLRKILPFLLISAAVIPAFRTNYVKNALLCWRTFREPVNALYSLSGKSLVPETDALRNLSGTTLLIGEERTLYFGKNVKTATPFFQSALFTPPDDCTPEKVLEIFRSAGAAGILVRIPEDNPDLNRDYLKRSEVLFQSLFSLERRGVFIRKKVVSGDSVLILEPVQP